MPMTKQERDELRAAIDRWVEAPHGPDCEKWGGGIMCLEGCPSLLALEKTRITPAQLRELLAPRRREESGKMPTNDDCPVCNGRKIILTRDYADCERDEPCPHCSEHEHCASCISLRAENARLREAVEKSLITAVPPWRFLMGSENKCATCGGRDGFGHICRNTITIPVAEYEGLRRRVFTVEELKDLESYVEDAHLDYADKANNYKGYSKESYYVREREGSRLMLAKIAAAIKEQEG